MYKLEYCTNKNECFWIIIIFKCIFNFFFWRVHFFPTIFDVCRKLFSFSCIENSLEYKLCRYKNYYFSLLYRRHIFPKTNARSWNVSLLCLPIVLTFTRVSCTITTVNIIKNDVRNFFFQSFSKQDWTHRMIIRVHRPNAVFRAEIIFNFLIIL